MPSRSWLIAFSKRLWRQIQEHRVLNGAGALAYFLLLAIFPAAIFLLTLLPYLAIPHMKQAIMDLVYQVLPGEAAMLFAATVQQVASEKQGGLLTFGVLFMLWSATTGMYAVIDGLNLAYGATEKRPYWKVQGTAFLLMLLFVVLVIGSLALAIFGGVAQSWVASIIGWSRPLLWFFATVRWIVIGLALLFGIAVIYRFGPNVNAKFRFISPGNVAAAILIALISLGVRVYVVEFGGYGSTYGSLGGIIVLMLWLYLAGIALMVGCEINAMLRLERPRQ